MRVIHAEFLDKAGGYRRSLSETARKDLKIVSQGGPS